MHMQQLPSHWDQILRDRQQEHLKHQNRQQPLPKQQNVSLQLGEQKQLLFYKTSKVFKRKNEKL